MTSPAYRFVDASKRYLLHRELGQGSMGTVYQAIDTVRKGKVAVKILKKTLASEETFRRRFEHEATVCAALKSKHIAQVSDYGVTSEGQLFYVMEYLPGRTLGKLLKTEGQLSVERALSILLQVCAGLRLAHEGFRLPAEADQSTERIKVVHRDLKPGNIFLIPTATGELVKILDFGIAKIQYEQAEQSYLTSHDLFLGTAHYAAPEQLSAHKAVDGRADIYSLGMIMYEMLSGTDPFGFGQNGKQSVNGLAWALAHSSQEPISLREQPGCETVPPLVEDIVMHCLEKLPSNRFNSVAELESALRAASQTLGKPIPFLQWSPFRNRIERLQKLDGQFSSTSRLSLLLLTAQLMIFAALLGIGSQYGLKLFAVLNTLCEEHRVCGIKSVHTEVLKYRQ